MKLAIIIVNYNTTKYLKQCLSLLFTHLKKIRFEVHVVDNNSQDIFIPNLRALFPQINIIRNKKNIGFASACNQVIKQTKGDYVLLLNPDVFVQKDTIATLIIYMDQHPMVGITSCKLLNKDKTLQYTCRRFSSVFTHITKRFFPRSKHVLAYLMAETPHHTIMEVDWLQGSFLLVRRKLLEEIGSLDERFFLYFEDVDFCRRAKQAGWKVIYNPKAVATHLFKQASRKLFSKSQLYHLQSMIRYYNKHGWKLI